MSRWRHLKSQNESPSQSVGFIEQSVKQLWGTIQWLWQCNFQRPPEVTPCFDAPQQHLVCSMADGEKRSQKPLIMTPFPLPSTFCWGEWNWHRYTALIHHYNVETESFYSTNSYTQLGEHKTSVWFPSRGWGSGSMRCRQVTGDQLVNGACRTSVLCSTHRTLQRERARQLQHTLL